MKNANIRQQQLFTENDFYASLQELAINRSRENPNSCVLHCNYPKGGSYSQCIMDIYFLFFSMPEDSLHILCELLTFHGQLSQIPFYVQTSWKRWI